MPPVPKLLGLNVHWLREHLEAHLRLWFKYSDHREAAELGNLALYLALSLVKEFQEDKEKATCTVTKGGTNAGV